MSDAILKALDSVETKLTTMAAKADAEMKDLGKVTTDTKTAIDALGVEQRTLADRLLQIEQKQSAQQDDAPKGESWGEQFVKAAG
jgi:hypothetical protein